MAVASVALLLVACLVTRILLGISLLLPALGTTVVFLALLLGIPGGVAARLPGIASPPRFSIPSVCEWHGAGATSSANVTAETIPRHDPVR
jgi:hypothetical protein